MTAANPKVKDSSNIDSEFARLCEQFCEYLKKYNIKIRPYHNVSVSEFAQLSADEKVRVLEQVKMTLEVYADVESHGEQLNSSPKLLWRAFSKLKLTPSSDVFDKMEKGDVIVVYSLDHRQIFRNLEYFETVSATFEEISTRPWWEIHTYPEAVSGEFAKLPEMIAAGHIQQTIPFSVPPYPVLDALGVDQIKAMITMKWMSPVRSGETIVGLMTCAKAEIKSA